MAEIVTTIKRYLGTEAERAALDTTNINAGSTYFESDTGLLYVLDGAGNWQLKGTLVAAIGGEVIAVAGNEDISGGVTAVLPNFSRWTLYLDVADAIDITISLSPDNDMFYPLDDPIEFSAAGYEVIEFGFTAMAVQLQGSNAELVTAQIRGVV